MSAFQFIISILLLIIALVLIYTGKGQSAIPTTIISSVCAFWFYKEKEKPDK